MNSSDTSHSIKTGSEALENTSDAHPDIDDLSLLLSNEHSFSKSNNDSLILHVAECIQCQKRLTLLTALNQPHQTIENTTVSEGQQMLIVDYVTRGFSISRKKLLRQKIQDEPSSLKAMLHYASHSEAMRLNLKQDMPIQENNSADDSKIEKTQTRPNLLSIISRLLMKVNIPFKLSFSFNFSTIYSIVVSFVSISLLFIVLLDKLEPVEIEDIENAGKLENKNSVEIEFVSSGLNDSNFIYAQETGEDSASEKSLDQIKKTLGKVKVRINEKQALHITWPVSGETNRYTLSFYAPSNQIKSPELSLTTTGSFVELDVKNFESGKKYRWVFSYQTLDEKIFRAQGAFIIKPVL